MASNDISKDAPMRCRICESDRVILVEHVQFYDDFTAPVYDCAACGSRFAESQPELFDTFHSNSAHYYTARMQAWSQRAKEFFDKGDIEGLKRQVGTFHFAMPYVIDLFEKNNVASILEAGCAWGYNSSYFILKGYDVLGVDISQSAVAQASIAFGDRFCTIDDPRYAGDLQFDGIFHLGTVGCVEKPVEFTRQLLDRLRPGGVLVFNAPTRTSADQLDTPWIWGACPPDLVTLFPDTFWHDQFSEDGEVKTVHVPRNAASSLRLRMQRRQGLRQPDRGSLSQPKAGNATVSSRAVSPMRNGVKSVVSALAAPFVKPVANDFGVIVSIKKR